jgi:hypothetical protein
MLFQIIHVDDASATPFYVNPSQIPLSERISAPKVLAQ